MKFWVSIGIICALVLSANQVLAINYQSDFSVSSHNWQIRSSQLSAAKLLQDYLNNYRVKINNLHDLYQGSNNVAISNFNLEISKMSRNLDNIQNNKHSASDAGRIMSKIVEDLKIINTRMKVFLEQEKIMYYVRLQEKQKNLSKIWTQISNTLDALLLTVSNKLILKSSLTNKEKRLVESLVILREENNKMKKFISTNFESQEEMNNYITWVIGSIRNEFKKIKRL